MNIVSSLKYCYVILFIVFFISCNWETDSKQKHQDSVSQKENTSSIDSQSITKDTILLVNENLKYKFQVHKENSDFLSKIISINYSLIDSDPLPKRIDLKEKDYAIFLKFDDYNYDGYLDMYIHNTCAILNNCHGYIYLFDPKLKEYIHNEQFDTLTTVTVNKKKNEIYSISRSQAGAIFKKGVYKMRNRQLSLIRYIIQGPAVSGWLFQITSFDVFGNSRIIKREINKYPTFEDEEKY